MSEARVLMLGLDALDGALLQQFIDDGRMPNLAAFVAESAKLDVNSDGETLHGSLWPTFASGRGPGEHGIYFWTQWLAEEMRHVRNTHAAFAFEPFWSSLPAAGRSAAIVDVPHTPLAPVEGIRQLVGWGLHDEFEPASWPHTFAADVRRRAGRNPLSFDTLEPQSLREKLVMARDMRRGVHMRGRLAAMLLEDGADLVVTTFSELHKAGHYLAAPQQLNERLSNVDAHAAIVGAFDAVLPRIVAAAGPDCHVFIFALHGMRPKVEYSQFGPQIVDAVLGRAPTDRAAHPDLLRRIRDLVPDKLHRAIWRRLPASVRSARQGQLSIGGTAHPTDPLFTVAHDGHPAIRALLLGREREGTLDSAAYERILKDLEVFSTSLVTENGELAFPELMRAQSRWAGSRAHRLPDALLVANPDVSRTNSLVSPDGRRLQSVRPEARNGAHTGAGFCFYRPAGSAAPLRQAIDPRDFGPTALSLLDAPLAESLEGSAFVQ